MWRRACLDTRSYFGWNRKTIIPPVAWSIGAFIYWLWQGWGAVKEEIAVAVAFIICPISLYFLGVYIFKLIRAPIYIKWEREKEPQLTIEGVSTVNYGNAIGHIWRLKVKNKGTNLAEDCRGQLIELADKMPQEHLSWDRWPINEYLEWGTGGGESISIPGHHTAELEIVTYGGIHPFGKHEEPLQLAYAKGKDFRRGYALKILRGGVIMLISIVSSNRLPIYAVCILHEYAEAHKNLELLEVTTNKPDITDYQRLDSHKEDSQT